jgi:hypothetical protein
MLTPRLVPFETIFVKRKPVPSIAATTKLFLKASLHWQNVTGKSASASDGYLGSLVCAAFCLISCPQGVRDSTATGAKASISQ